MIFLCELTIFQLSKCDFVTLSNAMKNREHSDHLTWEGMSSCLHVDSVGLAMGSIVEFYIYLKNNLEEVKQIAFGSKSTFLPKGHFLMLHRLRIPAFVFRKLVFLSFRPPQTMG